MTIGVASTHTPLSSQYRRFVFRRQLALGAFAIVAVGCWMLDVSLGPAELDLATILRGLQDRASLSAGEAVILWDIRLPQSLMALLVGAALGLAGAEIQTALHNPLASPFTLGVSAAATFGAGLAIVLGWDFFGLGATYAVTAFAFVTAAIATVLILVMTKRFGGGAHTVVLFGIALLFAFEALVWLLQFIADSDALQQIVFWTMGSLGRVEWQHVAIITVVLLVCITLSARQVWQLTALCNGEEQARSIGVAVERVRVAVLLRISLLTATAIAFVGTIGFVGLVGPHIARLTLGEDHRYFLPGSALAGAIMLSGASTLSKSLVPGITVPIGIVTALVGVPIFMALVLGKRRAA